MSACEDNPTQLPLCWISPNIKQYVALTELLDGFLVSPQFGLIAPSFVLM